LAAFLLGLMRVQPKGARIMELLNVSAVTPDVLVRNEGTVFVFCPLTERAQTWIDENVQSKSWQWLGSVFVVEHRYAWGLAVGMTDAGLVLA
jgi:hypothetical protein